MRVLAAERFGQYCGNQTDLRFANLRLLMLVMAFPVVIQPAKFLALALVFSSVLHATLTDAEIHAIRADGRQRNEAYFRANAGRPFVPAEIKTNWNNRGDFTRHYNQSVMEFAFRSFHPMRRQ